MSSANRARPGRGRSTVLRGRSAPRPSRRPPGVLVREATSEDLALLVRHRRRMWQAIGKGSRAELDDHDRRYRRWVRVERAAGRFTAFVATDTDGAVLGSGAVWLVPSQPRPGRLSSTQLPYILSMFTEPSARGRGVASRIVRAMIAWARARGFGRLTLHASKMGRPVYERLGFQAANEMRLELRPPRRGRPDGQGRTRGA